MLCGGIGITPMMSMLKELESDVSKKGNQVTMLYSVKQIQEIAFRKELEHLQDVGILVKLFITVTQDNLPDINMGLHQGRISDQDILNCVGGEQQLQTYDIFLCGPECFMQAIIQLLSDLKYPPNKINIERFDF